MKRIALVFVVFLVVGFGLSVSAQMSLASAAATQQSAAPAAPAAPAVPQDELVTAWLQTLAVQAKLAQKAIDALPEVQQYRTAQQTTLKKVEAKLPGYTVDLQRFAIVAKAPPKP